MSRGELKLLLGEGMFCKFSSSEPYSSSTFSQSSPRFCLCFPTCEQLQILCHDLLVLVRASKSRSRCSAGRCNCCWAGGWQPSVLPAQSSPNPQHAEDSTTAVSPLLLFTCVREQDTLRRTGAIYCWSNAQTMIFPPQTSRHPQLCAGSSLLCLLPAFLLQAKSIMPIRLQQLFFGSITGQSRCALSVNNTVLLV